MNLNEQEKEHFLGNGYVIKENVFSENAMQEVRDAITEMIQKKAVELQAQGKLKGIYENEPFEARMTKIQQENPDAAKEILGVIKGKGGGGYAGPAMLNALRNKNLVDCLTDLVGPDIIGSSVYRIRPKLSHDSAGEVPWHQDSGYIMPHCDKELIVTCWIPLIDITKERGCLFIVPGQHKRGLLEHCKGGNASFLVIPEHAMPETKPIPCIMPAGSVLFMTNLIPHASFANTSGLVRWSLDFRYQSSSVPNNVGETPADVTMDRDPVTMACFPPEADFVIRDSQNPQNEVTDPIKFLKIRKEFEKTSFSYPNGRQWKHISEYV